MTHKPVPPMRITADRYIDCAWLLPLFEIGSAESSLLESSFIAELSAIAKSKGIEVHYIDFNEYEDPIDAFIDIKNEAFKKAVEGVVPHGGTYMNTVVQQPAILIFDNCDSLAPLNCSLTFTLRSILTTQNDDNIKSIFIAKKKSLDMMFSNNKAAFYQSNNWITDRL